MTEGNALEKKEVMFFFLHEIKKYIKTYHLRIKNKIPLARVFAILPDARDVVSTITKKLRRETSKTLSLSRAPSKLPKNLSSCDCVALSRGPTC